MQKPDKHTLHDEHKKILDQRIANYQSDPHNLLDWKDVKKDMREGLSH